MRDGDRGVVGVAKQMKEGTRHTKEEANRVIELLAVYVTFIIKHCYSEIAAYIQYIQTP